MRVRLIWLWVGMLAVGGITVLLAYWLTGRADVWDYLSVLVAVLIGLLASVISLRHAGNRVVWLLHAISAAMLMVGATAPIVESGQAPDPFDVWSFLAVVVFTTVAEVSLYPVLLILWVFPTGRFLTRRWSWAGWVAGIITVVTVFVALFIETVGKLWDPGGEYWNLPNPVGFLPAEAGDLILAVAGSLIAILAVGGVVAMVTRYRRAEPVVREQLKWMAYAAGITGSAMMLMLPTASEVAWKAFPLVATTAIASAIAIAITRYKLFEIDRIISRTVSYALVAGLLAVVFAAGAIWIPGALGLEGSSFVVAGSTMAVAALFNPLRKRVQRAVDRRFNRSSYEMEMVSDQFAARLREPHTVEEIAALWKDTVDGSLQPRASGIWLSGRD